jgi:integrase
VRYDDPGRGNQVTTIHLKKYHTLRRQNYDKWKGSLHRANRELRAFSLVFRFARGEGWTTNNPMEPIKLKKLPGRKHIHISDGMLDAVYEKGTIALQDAIDLAYFLGQRPADILTLSVINKRDGRLEYRQGKTGTLQRIEINEEIDSLLKRIDARKAQYAVHSLYLRWMNMGRR